MDAKMNPFSGVETARLLLRKDSRVKIILGYNNEPGGKITVNGGSITAQGGYCGAGIGGGNNNGSGGTIPSAAARSWQTAATQVRASVAVLKGQKERLPSTTAQLRLIGSNGGAGIGGGCGWVGGTPNIVGGDGGSIAINGGAVTATGGIQAAEIGGGGGENGTANGTLTVAGTDLKNGTLFPSL